MDKTSLAKRCTLISTSTLATAAFLGLACATAAWLGGCAKAEDASLDFTPYGGEVGFIGTGGSAGTAGTSAGASAGSNPAGGGSAGSSGAGMSAGGAGATSTPSGGAGMSNPSGGSGGAPAGGSSPMSDGGSPTFTPGACAVTTNVSVQYKQLDTAQRIAAELDFLNIGDAPIPLSELKIRYFFSNEEDSPWKPGVFTAQINGGGDGYVPMLGRTTLQVYPLGTSVTGADTYAEFSFSGDGMLDISATGNLNFALEPTNYGAPDEVQSNDYSFNVNDTTPTINDHIAVYQGSTLIAGCLPKGSTP